MYPQSPGIQSVKLSLSATVRWARSVPARFAALKSSSDMASVMPAPIMDCARRNTQTHTGTFPRQSLAVQEGDPSSLHWIRFPEFGVQIRRIGAELGFGVVRGFHNSLSGLHVLDEICSGVVFHFEELFGVYHLRKNLRAQIACWKSHPLTLLSRINKDVLSIGWRPIIARNPIPLQRTVDIGHLNLQPGRV